ncbi:MAG: monovalent cation/H(+) antiporter subunit G [Pseudomonadota bacterium]|nr:monovalent cation/H(+) antiporter subunit G [Pseudomonadota bacterium]
MCLLAGAFFAISGGVGILRFPDFFTRIHATGVTDTICAGLILVGLMFQAGWSVALLKLFLILTLLLLTSPTATHAIARAALHGKLKPVLDPPGEPSSKS